MSDQTIGFIALLSSFGAIWLLWRAFKTGEAPLVWPVPELTREQRPLLFWLDVTVLVIMMIGGATASVHLIFLQ